MDSGRESRTSHAPRLQAVFAAKTTCAAWLGNSGGCLCIGPISLKAPRSCGAPAYHLVAGRRDETLYRFTSKSIPRIRCAGDACRVRLHGLSSHLARLENRAANDDRAVGELLVLPAPGGTRPPIL